MPSFHYEAQTIMKRGFINVSTSSPPAVPRWSDAPKNGDREGEMEGREEGKKGRNMRAMGKWKGRKRRVMGKGRGMGKEKERGREWNG